MDAIAFNSHAEASAWLNETGHYGRIEPIRQNGMWGKFMIVQPHGGQMWAFASEDKLIALTDW